MARKAKPAPIEQPSRVDDIGPSVRAERSKMEGGTDAVAQFIAEGSYSLHDREKWL